MQLATLLRDLRTVDVRGPVDRPVSGVTRDSRGVGPGVVFVAVRGERVDGHDFVPGLEAAAVVVEREVEARPGVPVVRVESTRRALALLSAAFRGHPARTLPVLGVTGTNGKTTLTTLVEQALGSLGRRAGRVGTTGAAVAGVSLPGSFTTPEAPELQALLARMRDERCEAVAIEVSSIGLALDRVDGIPFHAALFTNLSRDHLDFHGTMESYASAKSRLFRELLRPPGGPVRAVLCGDDPSWTAMGAPADRWTYGFGAANDLRIEGFRGDAPGFVLRTPEGPVELTSPLVGRHNALNLAGAWAALRTLGISADQAARGLSSAAGAPGRLERVPDPTGELLVLVDYAHSDDALANVLPAVRELTRGQVWLVFGCGGDRDRGKRPKMAAVAEALADRVVVTSDNPRTEDPAAIVAGILPGLRDPARAVVELDRAEAIALALRGAAPGDAVLIAGKGHETYQEIAGTRHPFDDREVARRALAARAGGAA